MGIDKTKTRKQIAIQSAEDFLIWTESIRLISFNNEEVEYTFRLPSFSLATNNHIGAVVNRHINACGCKLGSFIMSMTFVVVTANYFIQGHHISSIHISDVLICFGYAIVGALVGKCLGLLIARFHLLKFTKTITEKLNFLDSLENHIIHN